jgi:hypothetical protein
MVEGREAKLNCDGYQVPAEEGEGVLDVALRVSDDRA